MRTSSGLSTEAVYIFHNMVRKLKTQHKPQYLAAVFEGKGKTFRDEVFEAYKANRTETPPDLLEQIPWIRKTLEALRIPVLEYDGFEADDVIGTLACRAVEQGMEVAIVSSDKDMLQLVNPHVKMFNPMKDDIWYDEAETERYMGVKPSQVADLLALKGDAIDNIPGAPGIGDKGAKDLVLRFGSVEGALERAAEVERKTYRESLQNNRDQILLSKTLATIHTNVPVPLDLPALAIQEPDIPALREIFQKLDFISLLRDLPSEPKPEAERNYLTLAGEAELEGWFGQAEASAPVAVAVGEMMSATRVLGLASPSSRSGLLGTHAGSSRSRLSSSRPQGTPASLSASFAGEARRNVVRVSASRRSRRVRLGSTLRKTSGTGAGGRTPRAGRYDSGVVSQDASRAGGAQPGRALRDH